MVLLGSKKLQPLLGKCSILSLYLKSKIGVKGDWFELKHSNHFFKGKLMVRPNLVMSTWENGILPYFKGYLHYTLRHLIMKGLKNWIWSWQQSWNPLVISKAQITSNSETRTNQFLLSFSLQFSIMYTR